MRKFKILSVICVLAVATGLFGAPSNAPPAVAAPPAPTSVVYNLYATDGFIPLADGSAVYNYGFVGGRATGRAGERGMNRENHGSGTGEGRPRLSRRSLLATAGLAGLRAAPADLDLAEDPEILGELTLTRRYTKSTASYKNKQPHIQLVEKIKERKRWMSPFPLPRGSRAG